MNYVAPELEVLEVMVECGFAGSTPSEEQGTNMPSVDF